MDAAALRTGQCRQPRRVGAATAQQPADTRESVCPHRQQLLLHRRHPMVQGLRGACRRPASDQHEQDALRGAARPRRCGGRPPACGRERQKLHMRAVCTQGQPLQRLLRDTRLHAVDAQLQRYLTPLHTRRPCPVLQLPDGARLLPRLGRALQPHRTRLQPSARGWRLRRQVHVCTAQARSAICQERQAAMHLLP